MRIIFLLLAVLTLQAAPKVCLNMIVKNEAPVIERCLESIMPMIDYWVIVDTGSTDGTQDKIRKFMKDIPGELYERPWVNFGFNRNEALQLAASKGEYVLFIDADEIAEGYFDRNELDADAYLVPVRTSSEPLMTFLRGFMVRTALGWTWNGVIHEKLSSPPNAIYKTVDNTVLSAEPRDGHRSEDPNKYRKDAAVLEKALLDDPDNSDYVYYLAQSYYNCGEYELSLKNYQRRAQMSGWDQHTFWSLYQGTIIMESLGKDPADIIAGYSAAFQYRPTRVEPLCRLSQFLYARKNFILGYLVAKLGKDLPMPNDIVYLEPWMYSWGIQATYANCAMELGKYDEAAPVYEKLAKRKDVPNHVVEQSRSTLRFVRSKLIDEGLKKTL